MSQMRKDVTEHDVTGLKYFRRLLPLFERLHKVGCRRDKAENRTLGMDGHHASANGCYLAGCVWFEYLFGQSVVRQSIVGTRLVFRDDILREGLLVLQPDWILVVQAGRTERIDPERIATELPRDSDGAQL